MKLKTLFISGFVALGAKALSVGNKESPTFSVKRILESSDYFSEDMFN
jgi:hypothetical protein